MKKCFFALALLLGAGFASAKDMSPDKSDGCGPGWYIYKDKTILGTSIRGTTNAVIPGQVSGMTTGTSNCERHDIVKADKDGLHYTANNYELIVAEMAAGQGEFLNEYARVLGCDAGQFSEMAQQNFEVLVPSEENYTELLKNVKREIRVNALNCAV
jgi:hypothetical protein